MMKKQFISTLRIKLTALALLALLFSGNLLGNDREEINISEWLQLGSFAVNKPAFHSTENMKKKTFADADLLEFDYFGIETLEPVEGREMWRNGSNFSWEKVNAAKNGQLIISRSPDGQNYEMAMLAAYIQTDRWLEMELKVASPQMFEVFLDGKKITSKKSNDQPDAETPGSKTEKLKLERGKHLLIIKSLKTPEVETSWSISASLIAKEQDVAESLIIETNPQSSMEIAHLMNGTNINSANISADGGLVLLSFTEVLPPDGKRSSRYEIRETATGNLVQMHKGNTLRNLQWLPAGRTLSYVSASGKGDKIYTFDFEKMEERQLPGVIEDLGSYRWSPDGSFVIYTVSEKDDEKNELVKRYENMNDRWPWWRNRSFLYKLDPLSGAKERLTYGHLATSLEDIRHDGRKILFSQSIPDFSERPYSQQILFEIDLETLAVDTIRHDFYGGSFSYSPDGENLLVTGSSAMFDNIGINVTGDVIPNDYDTQAYLYNMVTGDINPVTFNFNPSIASARWSKYNPNIIYFLATDRTYKHLFSYDLNTQYFEKIETGFDVVNSFSPAADQALIVCTGSNISTPKYASLINLETADISTIAAPQNETYENVVFGKTEDWNFENINGVTIEGRIYYPPDFDPDKKYPLIVYYYAGTSPTDRSFGGRYPKNLFAAQGYVVYNLQPSGAIGWGQDFSAAHVNNWGVTVADEIIDGTRLFLDEHSFIDKEKVGCIGASYGGFMTMLLQTRTDIFAAAISHAGISAISSYWGEGYWGYLYSSAASANSFPWNNRQLYIEQSALYNADKINTPLLLLHGDSDTNVPPGESIQLFAALKLLGKPVELIEIRGQDHHILDYEKRIKWQKTIFAWFDKWLKDQPEWWNELYPERRL
jgi:dipeptidyl aminopeptidase/acylaminoacyl peptidase